MSAALLADLARERLARREVDEALHRAVTERDRWRAMVMAVVLGIETALMGDAIDTGKTAGQLLGAMATGLKRELDESAPDEGVTDG